MATKENRPQVVSWGDLTQFAHTFQPGGRLFLMAFSRLFASMAYENAMVATTIAAAIMTVLTAIVVVVTI